MSKSGRWLQNNRKCVGTIPIENQEALEIQQKVSAWLNEKHGHGGIRQEFPEWFYDLVGLELSIRKIKVRNLHDRQLVVVGLIYGSLLERYEKELKELLGVGQNEGP